MWTPYKILGLPHFFIIFVFTPRPLDVLHIISLVSFNPVNAVNAQSRTRQNDKILNQSKPSNYQ